MKNVISALMLALALGAVTAHAADTGYCKQYADTALRQFAQAKEAGCDGLNYPVWSMDFNHHYGWCMTVPASRAQAGTAQRSKAFAMCREVATQGPAALPLPIPQDQGPAVSPIPIP
jgi:hypothetical protein